MRKIVSSNLQLPQRVWASAQQSLSKLAFAFALHHSCTLLEPASVPPRSQQVSPREATKRLRRTRLKEAAAKHGFAAGKRVDCRRQFKRGVSRLLLMKKLFIINGSNFFL